MTPEQAWKKVLNERGVFVQKDSPLGGPILEARDAAIRAAAITPEQEAVIMAAHRMRLTGGSFSGPLEVRAWTELCDAIDAWQKTQFVKVEGT